jgi:hypothetical protein
MVPDHLPDDEGEERLREFGVEVRVGGQAPQAGDLADGGYPANPGVL